jgi:hypothetical protein
MFYHEDAFHYALPVVLRESLPGAQSEARRSTALYLDVLGAIRLHGSEPIWLSTYDWDAARERVNAVLSAAGGMLPR